MPGIKGVLTYFTEADNFAEAAQKIIGSVGTGPAETEDPLKGQRRHLSIPFTMNRPASPSGTSRIWSKRAENSTGITRAL